MRCSLLPLSRTTVGYLWSTMVRRSRAEMYRSVRSDNLISRFFIIGSGLALIGSIIGATAQNVNTLIAAEVLIGIAVAFQQSFFWVVAEIVPMKWRYIANSYCYLMTTPTSPLAARVAYSFQTYPGKWRNRSVLRSLDESQTDKFQLLLPDRHQCYQHDLVVSLLPPTDLQHATPEEAGEGAASSLRLDWCHPLRKSDW